jgi:Flp pilus assembly protein TadG
MIAHLLSRALRAGHGERGQALWVAALILPALLAATGLAMDIGGYAAERRTLQNAADAIALAAAQGLPDQDRVEDIAEAWALKNNVDPGDMTVTVSGGTVSPAVTIRIERTHEFAFMPIVSIDERDVSARAVAGKFTAGASTGVVPWSITQATANAANSGQIVTVKFDASSQIPAPGNFGSIRIDGSGATDYEDAAKYGSTKAICSQGTPRCEASTCPGSYPATCAENSPECDGAGCPPKTGNMPGPSRDAIDFRMNNTKAACDTFAETFTPVPETPPATQQKYALNAACNPWGAGACPPKPSAAACSRRVFLIPIIDEFLNGSSGMVTIRGFALVYLEGYDTGKCTGNNCEVKVRFVRADVTTGAFAGQYHPSAFLQFVKLVE